MLPVLKKCYRAQQQLCRKQSLSPLATIVLLRAKHPTGKKTTIISSMGIMNEKNFNSYNVDINRASSLCSMQSLHSYILYQ